METLETFQISDDEAISELHAIYQERLNYIGVRENDEARFSWSQNKKVKIYLIKIHSSFDGHGSTIGCLSFAVSSEKNCFKYLDLFSETNNFEFETFASDKPRISYLLQHKLIPENIQESILISSLQMVFIGLNLGKDGFISSMKGWCEHFVDTEYKRSKTSLENRDVTEDFPISNQMLFIDKYHFNEMLNAIDDDQFTDEFNQCLFAYENEKWFLCATGIGSCLEHLMLLTLTNYGKEKQLGRNPTASNYLKAFTNEPLNIEPRQQTYIDTLFRLRNSVDHHNSGYTSKGICDMLLDGVSSIFNEYYEPSKIAKKTSQSN